jgi:CheY-like chemotaxis protein
MKNSARIAIVEDCFIQSTVMKKIFESEGYNVIGMFKSGEDALSRFETEKPDIYIMDINLNGELNGFETVNVIRQTSQIPAIFVTASNNTEILEKVGRFSPSALLVKPVFKDSLLRKVDELTGIGTYTNVLDSAS